MEIICKRKCFDAENQPYIIGGKYKWYDIDYVYMVPYNEKLYNIYLDVGGIDVFMGTGTLSFIEYHFDETDQFITRCICTNAVTSSNGMKFKQNTYYKYSIKLITVGRQFLCCKESEEVMYTMYSDSGIWMSYVTKSFIDKNFITYSKYIEEWLQVDELFNEMLSR